MLTPSFKKGLTVLTATALLATAAVARPEVRDPFVNQKGPAPQGRTAPVVRPGGDRQVVKPTERQAISQTAPAVTKIINAPDVTVSGIVTSRGVRQAILSDGQRSYMVREGQQLADFKVKAISSASVTLDCEGQSFKIPMSKG